MPTVVRLIKISSTSIYFLGFINKQLNNSTTGENFKKNSWSCGVSKVNTPASDKKPHQSLTFLRIFNIPTIYSICCKQKESHMDAVLAISLVYEVIAEQNQTKYGRVAMSNQENIFKFRNYETSG